MAIRCIFFFAQVHAEFRLPELQSIAKLHCFQFSRPADAEEWDPSRPFWIIELEEEAHVLLLAERCILIKSVYELYACGKTYEDVHRQTRENAHLWASLAESPTTTFKFTVNGYNHSIPMARVREVVSGFSYMDFKGPVDLKNPNVRLAVYEEYADRGKATVRDKSEGDGDFACVYFGRLITEGKARPLIKKYDVKKRLYYGNTSMDAEVSLLMANQALASPGKFIYDPFVGTGSMAYTAAEFGAFVFGSDIDGRQMRGKGTEDEPGIRRAAAQYGVSSRIIDLCTFDITNNPWRTGGLFDAILTDPPYGVRAGAKRLGRKPTDTRVRERRPEIEEALTKGLLEFVPPTRPYELSELVADLVQFARHLLRPQGRLVFFLPTVTDEYTEVDVYALLCPGMEVIANSVQDFGSWGRRLITIEKTSAEDYPSPFLPSASIVGESGGDDAQEPSAAEKTRHAPAHKDFREKYFKGFRKEVEEKTETDGGQEEEENRTK